MKERPIIFSGPMVRAILEGRKTQTRRVVKLNSAGRIQLAGHQWHSDDPGAISGCPYGKPGHRLWVKETFREAHPVAFQDDRVGLRLLYAGIPGPPPVDYLVAYRADGELLPIWHSVDFPYRSRTPDKDLDREINPEGVERAWDSPLFMPKQACRLFLEVTETRVQRLDEITGEDAIAEGVADVVAFRRLWSDINGAKSWDANPLVWAVTFRRVE